jgi:hypothetical protein
MEAWSLSKASSYLMHLLAQVIPPDVMKNIVTYIEANLVEENFIKRNSAISLFIACMGNAHKMILGYLAGSTLDLLLKLIFDENPIIKKNISLLLVKITKHYVRMMGNDKINTLISTFIGCLAFENAISINYCLCLMNIITAIGDPQTTKNSTLLSSHFDNISKELVSRGLNDSAFDREHNLSLYCILTLDSLISNSSNDKQSTLLEIIVYFTTELEKSCGMAASDAVYQIQSYYCVIIRSVLKKLVTSISKDIAEKVFKTIEESFKQRQGVYDEGLLAISALATSNYIFNI